MAGDGVIELETLLTRPGNQPGQWWRVSCRQGLLPPIGIKMVIRFWSPEYLPFLGTGQPNSHMATGMAIEYVYMWTDCLAILSVCLSCTYGMLCSREQGLTSTNQNGVGRSVGQGAKYILICTFLLSPLLLRNCLLFVVVVGWEPVFIIFPASNQIMRNN